MSGTPQDTNGWDGYRKLVLHEIKRLSDNIDDMDQQNRRDHQYVVQELGNVKTEIGSLKTKASLFGGLSGLGAAIAVFAASLFGHGIGR